MIEREAAAVIASTEDINKDLTKVQDVTPWWSRMIMWGSAAAAVVAIAVVLWRSGVLAWMSAWLRITSPSTKRRADMLRKATENKLDMTEVIAAERASPAFNAEWKRQGSKKQ